MTRRDFLEKLGWGAVLAALGGLAGALARFLEPNVTTPAAGPAEIAGGDFPPGSLTYVENARAYIGRDQRGYYAIVAVCTHLGCTPRLEPDSTTFACPCHGSRFSPEGEVVTGPAARALDRAWVGRAANGHLVVDRRRVVSRDFRLPAA